MKLQVLSTIVTGLGLAMPAVSATFSPTFDTPGFVGTQFNVEPDPSYNEFYSENFGITVSNAYLYVDPRDTFDGIGIANGFLEENNSPDEAGRIDFLDTTDFVDLSYAAIFSGGTYEAYDADGMLLDSFSTGPGTSVGETTLDGGIISYILFTGTGGEVGVSALTYNFDGVTDGVNNDLPGTVIDVPVSPVPLPASGLMLFAALAAGGLMRRKAKQS